MKFLLLSMVYILVPFKLLAFDGDVDSPKLQRQILSFVGKTEKTRFVNLGNCRMTYGIQTNTLKYKEYYNQYEEVVRLEKYRPMGSKNYELFYNNGQLVCKKQYNRNGRLLKVKEYSVPGRVYVHYKRR